MIIKEVRAEAVKDSRQEQTIQVIIKTSEGIFGTTAPSGKSTGKYEARPYSKTLRGDIGFINKLKPARINRLIIQKFEDLIKIENLIKNKIGANTLFVLEASILKALAYENGKELWKFLGGGYKLPRPVGNAVGGGVHSRGRSKKPDFQEFLFIANGKTIKECVETNRTAHELLASPLEPTGRNDEGAWKTDKTNEEVLEIMADIKEIIRQKYNQRIEIGIDCASSSFFKKGFYCYKNPAMKLNKKEQVKYIKELIKGFNLFYIEDGLNEDDFSGFFEIYKSGRMIVGDDLTATNPKRVEKAVKMKSVDGIIIKPNQIGSLLKVKEVIDLCRKYNIKTIMSHRSGETTDDTIADLAVGWGCDFIKTGIYGKEREAKLKRLVEIEKKLRG